MTCPIVVRLHVTMFIVRESAVTCTTLDMKLASGVRKHLRPGPSQISSTAQMQ
jgi:hypothetical protein